MLRVIRIILILVFALFAAHAGNKLSEMYTSGELSQQYNTPRKTNITLLTFSLLALAGLGYFEFVFGRRKEKRRGYGRESVKLEKPISVSDNQSSCIYAAPETKEAWMQKSGKSSKSRKRRNADMNATGFWFGMLRVLCMVMPVFYIGMAVLFQARVDPDKPISHLLPLLFLVLFFLALIAVYGVLRKGRWGLILGYVLSVFNVLIFPYGTALGLVLLVGLVGAAPVFEDSFAERRKHAKMKARKRMAQKRQAVI